MSQILCSDWLPEQARGAILPGHSYLLCPTGKFSKKSHVINPLLTKIVQSRHLDIGLNFCEFMDLDLGPWTDIKKNLTTIQPS